MFSALKQGSIVYILEKGDRYSFKTGQIVSTTQPSYNSNYFASTLDINVKVGNEVMEFRNISAQSSIANYNNAIITETKELMSNEVDSILQNSKNIIDSVPYHNSIVESCEEIQKELNPRFAKERERDEDINNLKVKIGGIETKMDKILTLLSKDETK